ncbi:hypothetical protein [Solwaraspora sp. WMMD792]|uniref:hypothetical protein n=1 Tax=Solwaraspora sp. WMMD792 TaxID=3016099 RepID=UPI0024170417|nr:hypothetical protein [Solwaraspora sp. WMMD792]MDG4771983.1 hypothetical protein [Solwaraspora sp. WMMD792]
MGFVVEYRRVAKQFVGIRWMNGYINYCAGLAAGTGAAAGLGGGVTLALGIKGVEFLALRVAQELLKRLTARTLGKAVPIVGAVVGGGLNFAFIKAVGSTLLAFEDQIFNDVAERPAIGG